MSTAIDKEIEAIGTVLKALEPLDTKARESVLAYILQRLDINAQEMKEPPSQEQTPPYAPGDPPDGERGGKVDEMDIKDLKEEKNPRSGVEMATLVAYYLAHKAPTNERKQTITTNDMVTHFQSAGFKLPKKPEFTLNNTKNAGYLDSVGTGEFKLNPVGYNLVVHSMPKSKKPSSG